MQKPNPIQIFRSKILEEKIFSSKMNKLLPQFQYILKSVFDKPLENSEIILKTDINTIKPEKTLKKKLNNSPKSKKNPIATNFRLKSPEKLDLKKEKITKNNVRRMSNIPLDQLSIDERLEMAILILQKHPKIRSQTEISNLMSFTSNVAFFRDKIEQNKLDIHEECCRNMEYKFCESNEMVFREGMEGDTFYIILQGEVGIYKFLSNDKSPDKLKRKSRVLKEIVSLKSGFSFGETALIEDKPRNATVICKENCYFAVLNKGHFQKILKTVEKRKIDAIIDFLSNLNIFKGISITSIRNLYKSMVLISYKRNNIVYKQNDNIDKLYIIKKGSFKVFKEIKINNNENSKKIDLIKKFESKKQKYEICIISEGETFGEEELITGEKRKFTIICDSNEAEVYSLDEIEFNKKLIFDSYSKNYMLSYIEQKTKTRENRFVIAKEILTNETKDEVLYHKSRKYKNLNDPTIESDHYFLFKTKEISPKKNRNKSNSSESQSIIEFKRTMSVESINRKFLKRIGRKNQDFINFKKNQSSLISKNNKIKFKSKNLISQNKTTKNIDKKQFYTMENYFPSNNLEFKDKRLLPLKYYIEDILYNKIY